MKTNCNIEFKRYNGKFYPCATSFVMDLIGGKWQSVILCQLNKNTKRFSELKKELSFITESTLNNQLKKLEKNELVEKQIYGNKAPYKVEYKLTSLGKSFIPLINQINDMGKIIMSKTN